MCGFHSMSGQVVIIMIVKYSLNIELVIEDWVDTQSLSFALKIIGMLNSALVTIVY
jgi:hypothetical protein